jgi:microcystin-dependent protein
MKKQQFATIEEGFFNFVTDYVNHSKVEPVVIPRGVIVIWSGAANAIPTGWALCDGTSNTPDLRGRFVLGGIAGTGTNSIGNKGGVSEITLQQFNLPDHNHNVQVKFSNISTSSNGSHNHNVWYPSGGQPTNTWTNGINNGGGFNRYKTESTDWIENAGSHTHTFSLDSTFTTNNGNQPTKSQPIPILNPYYALAYIMKL